MAEQWLSDPIIYVVVGVMVLGLLAGLLDCLPQGRLRPRGLAAGAAALPGDSGPADHAGQVAAMHRVLAVIEYDLQGQVLGANQNFLDLFGCRLADIRGRHHSLFCPPGVAGSEAYRDLWERLRRGEYETGEYRRLALDGRELWIHASYNPIFGADGKPEKVVEFASDISFHREMESDLLEAKERAERAAEAKSAFLANMSHEIRTPMNAIIGFTELLLDSPLDEQQRRHLHTVQHSARSLLALLNAILDTAKLERGLVELEEVDFSLRELAERTCALLLPNAAAKGLSLDLDYAEGLGDYFRGDPLRIQQVLLNLLGNALKFTSRGGVRLQVCAAGGELNLVVHDSGIGIPADRLERIFEPFAQADVSMSRRFGGTGLGTTIARQLVELMGGRIEVHSQVGVGSRFGVRLALPVASGALPAQQERPLPALPRLKILVADDVAENVELLMVGLGRLGHRVSSASDGAEALAALERERFDLVLMDVQMPGVDGLEACHRWRAREQAVGLPRTPVIALTASVLDRDREAARAAGMDGFAAKPVALEQLLGEIARVTGHAVAPVAGVERPVGELPAIDWSQGLALWGSEQAQVRAIRTFCRKHVELPDELQGLLEGGREREAQQLLHRLRGLAGNLGLRRLAGLLGELERAGAEARRVPASDLQALRQALAELPGELPVEPSAAAMEVGVSADRLADLRAPCERLARALRRGELDEAALAELADGLGRGDGARNLAVLQAAIDDFDFDRALQLLEQLQARLATQERQPT